MIIKQKITQIIHRIICRGKIDEPIVLMLSTRGFNDFARGLFARRNMARHGDVIATFVTGTGQKVIMKIHSSAETNVY